MRPQDKFNLRLATKAPTYLALVVMLQLSGCAILKDENQGDRFAASVKTDALGDDFTEVKYLDQGWSVYDSL